MEKRSGEDSIVGGINYSELIFGECIGSGGYGEVYSGTYKSTNVAIKKQTRTNSRTQRSFINEIEVLKSLRHTNIMQYFGSCEHNGELYIVTQLLGRNLADECLSSTNTPRLYQRIKYAYDGAVGIRWLHEHQPESIIHRDIKPENFLLNVEKTRVVVCDFGISQFVTDDDDGSKVTLGKKRLKTPLWSSPEVNNGEPITTKSDVYSFGLFLWSMLTCKYPFNGIGK